MVRVFGHLPGQDALPAGPDTCRFQRRPSGRKNYRGRLRGALIGLRVWVLLDQPRVLLARGPARVPRLGSPRPLLVVRRPISVA